MFQRLADCELANRHLPWQRDVVSYIRVTPVAPSRIKSRLLRHQGQAVRR